MKKFVKIKKNILFICKKRIDSYGFSFGLLNSANFVSNYLNKIGYNSEVIDVIDGNSIDKEVFLRNPDLVVIEALWVTAKKFRELLSLKRHQGRKWIVRLHSKIPFIANEGIAFSWLNEYKQVAEEFPGKLIIAPNAKEFSCDLSDMLGIKTLFLPNIYCDKKEKYSSAPVLVNGKVIETPKVSSGKRIINIGCFGAIRPLKNQLIQAVAAIKFANHINKKLRFHMNIDRQEQKGDQVLKNIIALFDANWPKHRIVSVSWLPHPEFMKLVRKMDLGLQVSYSETFNIVAADMVSAGVPIVVSSEIDWIPDIFAADPNSSEDIFGAMNFAYYSSKIGFHNINKAALWYNNYKSEIIWENALSDLLERPF